MNKKKTKKAILANNIIGIDHIDDITDINEVDIQKEFEDHEILREIINADDFVSQNLCNNRYVVITSLIIADEDIASITTYDQKLRIFDSFSHPCKTREEALGAHDKLVKYINRNKALPPSFVAIHDADDDAGII